MPDNCNLCGNCPFCNPQSNKKNPNKSKNLNYIYAKNHMPLNKECHNSKTLLVFEAPGIDEWNKRKPICGKRTYSAGYNFSNALKQCSKNRNDYDITEAIQCFPGTSTKTKNQKNQKNQCEVNLASIYCLKYLSKDIDNGNYMKIICFGGVAYRSVRAILEIRNSINKITLIHIVHPSVNENLVTDVDQYL